MRIRSGIVLYVKENYICPDLTIQYGMFTIFMLGKTAWQWFSVIAAFAAVIKSLLGLPKKIKEYESLFSGYRTLEHDLHEIKVLISEKGKYDNILKLEFKKALKRRGALVSKEQDAKEDKKLKKNCENEVLTELPSSLFFVPEE